MVATIPKSESPTHELGKRLHTKLVEPTTVELKTALALQASAFQYGFVVVRVGAIAQVVGTSRTQVMHAIKRMRRLGLIAAEFAGIDDRIVAVIARKEDDSLIAPFLNGLIEGDRAGGTAAA